ncbi:MULTISPECIES: helix-turn-helix transcriptional regulator [unclassified Gordonia (in: high G+C Gram-positive bacteria)]|uniref:helix-turn-helix transcriptional regulator n=1 Tax=unclassified Gordonia (in: high G+C Gram-positive bacteria) TaxID=2657482 RepID=UPI001F107BC5|nr:helix-turn-helix transcriptional regulator [Gordonia sp. ABSL49_1]MCH5643308.1 helix-turn-helix transcriptional regulator [Gordonia sp. ABSL49_1]
MDFDRAGLAEFLRRRREALTPADVGLPAGSRRRTSGLRREEVALLAQMSTDYYSRLEQQRGPHPSEQMLTALARALHLSLDERDHLFRLAGQHAPGRRSASDHVGPGMLRIVDRLADTPAMVVNSAGETLLQTMPAKALVGDETHFEGVARSIAYRWFTDPATRQRFPADDHDHHARAHTARLRAAVTTEGPDSRAAVIADALLAESPEFASLWKEHDVNVRLTDQRKRLLHPELGLIEVFCQTLFDPDANQGLLVYTATPGTVSHEKLAMLSAVSV